MDYVDWLQVVLSKVVELSRGSFQAGVHDQQVAESILGSFIGSENYFGSDQRRTTYDTFEELIHCGLAEKKSGGNAIWVMPTHAGRDLVIDPLPFWEIVCSTRLDEKQETALRYFNNLSQKIEENYSLLQEIDSQECDSVYDNDEGKRIFLAVARELKEIGFLKIRETANVRFKFCSTYKGLVWEHRRVFTSEAKFIDQLVKEWETTSVDFKRELTLNNDNQKAEFVKDVLSLANTQASGRRWMIIGFDDKTRTYYQAPDSSLTQNRFEQILSCYTAPVVSIKYEVADYRSGPVGKLEVLRESVKLPYKVAKTVGGKKQIIAGEIFVRHGSQVEKPTSDERQAIEEEGERARELAKMR
jgi:hypothetical protein